VNAAMPERAFAEREAEALSQAASMSHSTGARAERTRSSATAPTPRAGLFTTRRNKSACGRITGS
jgi:hypothetical protein